MPQERISEESLQTGKVLVVDDNAANLQVLSSFLDESGFDTWTARSGDKALKLLEIDLPDLILLDVMMPGIDGFETCRLLKENPRTHEIPVIFMTAFADVEQKVKGLQLGAVDYITKPFHQREVLARIELHLRLRSLIKSLEAKNAELKRAQTKLVHAEKIASLGQLVSGIAHEVNNPINFIAGNLIHIKQYTQELTDLLALYQQHLPNPPPDIQTTLTQINISYLLDDLPRILTSMQVGTDRIIEIVSSLRTFSRIDESGKKLTNLHEGINSTLLILGHRLSARTSRSAIRLIKTYGDLPLVPCYPGEINLVFMNLLSNAIDAIDAVVAPSRDYTGTIEVKTFTQAEWAIVQISDNGVGISEAAQQNIFDAFFTTKPPGKGTGLGLSLSHQVIVENHDGQLCCKSTPGQGTQFTLQLPLH